MAYVTGIAMYPALARQNRMTGKYSMDITQLDDETVKALEEEGVNVKESDDKGRWILVKSDYKPKVKDTKGNDVPDEVIQKIGNGSKVSIPLKVYMTEYKKKKYYKVSLGTVFLRKLEEFQLAPDFDDEDDDFVVDVNQSKDEFVDDDIPF